MNEEEIETIRETIGYLKTKARQLQWKDSLYKEFNNRANCLQKLLDKFGHQKEGQK